MVLETTPATFCLNTTEFGSARQRLNDDYLAELSFAGDRLCGEIAVGNAGAGDSIRLRQLLEKLELYLRDANSLEPPPSRGLGSNNLLFIASELLLLSSKSEDDGFPLLLIEEPEAHLHPQRQLRLMQFLVHETQKERECRSPLQVLLTTHSPNLASVVDVGSLVLMQGGRAFPLGSKHTLLDKGDYAFLQRFLDVTKANLFFARGVLIVEGDAEAIILPTIARLIGRDLTEHGVSVVNVGGVGLRRYARIFMRRDVGKGQIMTPVACIADLDIMPDCAPAILGLLKPDGSKPPNRRWRCKADFPGARLADKRSQIVERESGQSVKTFVADEWTLEYDLAFCGLSEEVHLAASLADADGTQRSFISVARRAVLEYRRQLASLPEDEAATRTFSLFHGGASKAIGAQCLAGILEHGMKRGKYDTARLRTILPHYLVAAIDYATSASSS